MNPLNHLLKSNRLMTNFLNGTTKCFSSKKTKCEPDDLCPCAEFKAPRKPYKLVYEKTCEPCPFECWEPKEVDLSKPMPKPKPKKKKVWKKRKCYPGMEEPPKPPTISELKDAAKHCWKVCGAKHVNREHCPTEEELESPKYVKRICYRAQCPKADWDTDGC